MTNTEEFLAHAARCNRLAATCRDPVIAEKLRQLAQDYSELAGQTAPQAPACRPADRDPPGPPTG